MTRPLTALRRHTVATTALGDITLVASGATIEGLYFPHHWHMPDPATFGPRVEGGFDEVIRELREYLDGCRRAFTVPTLARGDALRRRVWELICEIPYGATTTYGTLAGRLNAGVDAKQVGAMVGSNPLPILIPCHRVVGSTGKLTGYSGGLRRKELLLNLEGTALAAGQ